MKCFLRFSASHTLLALAAALTLCVTPAKAVMLSTLLDPGQTIQVGDKLFSGFSYTVSGTMPPADQVNVTPYTDALGNFGIQFQGSFLAFIPSGAADSLIDFNVTSLDPNSQIVGVNLSGNPDMIGGNGFMSVTESFLPDVTNATLNIFDITPGTQKLSDSIMFGQGYQTLHVQKDIQGFSAGGVATMSFLRQTFIQASGPLIPEPSTITLMTVGLGALALVGWRKRRA